jgi:DNA-binding beta-propeller fold protein YncE
MRRTNTARCSGALIVAAVLALMATLACGTEALAQASGGRTTTVVSLPAGVQVTGVAVAAGAVWVANGRTGTVSRIDPQTTQVVSTISVAEPMPTCERCLGAVAAHGDTVWASMHSAGPIVVRIDARLNRVMATIPVGVLPDVLAVDEEGAVWLTASLEGAVVRVDPRAAVGLQYDTSGSFTRASDDPHQSRVRRRCRRGPARR